MRRLEVRLDFGIDAAETVLQPRRVGTLAEDGTTLVFEYDAAFRGNRSRSRRSISRRALGTYAARR